MFLGIGIVLGAGILVVLVATPMGKAAKEVAKNLFLADATKDPRVAEGVYLAAIEDKKAQYSKAKGVRADLLGRKQKAGAALSKAQQGLAATEDKCKKAAQINDIQALNLYVTQKAAFEREVQTYTAILSELEPRDNAAAELCRTLETQITELERKKDVNVSTMKLTQDMSKVYDQLDTLTKKSGSELLVQHVEANMEKSMITAAGKAEMHEEKLDVRIKRADERIAEAGLTDEVQKYLAQYGGNGNTDKHTN